MRQRRIRAWAVRHTDIASSVSTVVSVCAPRRRAQISGFFSRVEERQSDVDRYRADCRLGHSAWRRNIQTWPTHLRLVPARVAAIDLNRLRAHFDVAVAKSKRAGQLTLLGHSDARLPASPAGGATRDVSKSCSSDAITEFTSKRTISLPFVRSQASPISPGSISITCPTVSASRASH